PWRRTAMASCVRFRSGARRGREQFGMPLPILSPAFPSPGLIVGGERRLARVLIANSPHVAPILVHLLQGSLHIERHIRIVRQWHFDSRQALAQLPRIEREMAPVHPAAYADKIIERSLLV